MLVFEERGKPDYPEKNLSKQGREPTTNSTHICRRVRESNSRPSGGRRALSPLRHPCFPILSYPLSNVFLSYPLSNVFISVSVYLENVRIGLSGNKLYSADHKIVLKRLLLSTKHYHCCQHAHLK